MYAVYSTGLIYKVMKYMWVAGVSISYNTKHYISWMIRAQLCMCKSVKREVGLGSLAPDPSRKLNILGHDGNTLGVDGTQISVFKKTNQVSLGRFL